MNNKNRIFKIALLAMVVLVSSCSSEKESDLVLDCSDSTLKIEVVSQSDLNCESLGSATVSASGGAGDYMYSVNGGAMQESGLFEDLSAGTFSFTAKDGDGCESTISVVIGSDAGDLTLSIASSTEAGCETNNGSVTLSATGGDGTYQYQVGTESLQTSPEFSGLAQGEYTFKVVDGNGCSTSVAGEIGSGVSLSTDIMPIITANCAVSGCHNGSRSPNLSTANQVKNSASRVLARTSNGTMPPGGSLSQAHIDLITCWVNDGAENN
ncbi:MAG: hypothetical protein JXR10_01235 [Cyclobacteriaceae bacterium]